MKKITLVILLIISLIIFFPGCGAQSVIDDLIGDETSSQNDTDSSDSNGGDFTEQTVTDYFNHITETYSSEFIRTGFDKLTENYPYNFKYINMLKEKTVIQYDELSEYISNSEVKQYTGAINSSMEGLYDGPGISFEGPDSVRFSVQYVDEMQAVCDDLWGKGRLDIREYLLTQGDGETSYLSKKDVFLSINYPNEDDNKLTAYFDINEISIDGDTAKVFVNCVSVTANSFYSEYGYAIDDTDGRLVGDNVENDWFVNHSKAKFFQVLSLLGIDRSYLGEYVYTIKNSADGLFIDDMETNNDIELSYEIAWPNKRLEYIEHCEVDADIGLNLRKGPGTEFDVIKLLPHQLRVNELGYNNIEDDWLFVSCTLGGIEYFGWVSKDYIMFYGGMAKPVIYLYPETAMDINVEVSFKTGGFTCTYPEYRDGWNVLAYPDGRVIDNADGLEYSYLYWEGEGNIDYDMSRGFVVKGEDTATFLREKLSYMGLTPREYNEFIVYWLPLMHGNNYNLITFQTTAYTENVLLNVSPEPDSIQRIFMVYMPLDEYIAVPQQELAPFEREGFSVIEWGGTEY